MADQAVSFEQGPIRPPSEASSLLIRLTRNCPWNRCLFCPVYKTEKFSRRTLEEIEQDIDNIGAAADRIKSLSREKGSGGTITREIVYRVQSSLPALLPVALWLYYGSGTVFLQDADSMILPTGQLTAILSRIRRSISGVTRVTTYGRSRSLLRKSTDELALIREAGLDRIHVGMESGYDPVLAYMRKGVTGQEQVEAGQAAKAAGLTLSEYVILGLGGKSMWREHALATAEALNAINPDFIRVRTLAVHPASPLAARVEEGDFIPLDDETVLLEEKLLLENLRGIDSVFQSDHILNLLEEVEGRLPGDRQSMIGVIDGYFALPEPERERFRLGRRTAVYRRLDDRRDPALARRVEQLYERLAANKMTVDDYIRQVVRSYL